MTNKEVTNTNKTLGPDAIVKNAHGQFQGFLEFIRTQGVVGLAVGFILGGSISRLVASLVDDIINPIIGLALGYANNLSEMSTQIAGATIMWGSFVNSIIDFTIIAIVVYFGVKMLGLDKIDPKVNKAMKKK